MGTKCSIYTPIGNFGFLSIRRKLWSLSFPLRDDFTLNCHLQVTLVVRPLVGNFGHCPSLLGMTLLCTIHPQVTLVFRLSVGEFNHCPFLLGMTLLWTIHLQVTFFVCTPVGNFVLTSWGWLYVGPSTCRQDLVFFLSLHVVM